MFSDPVVGDDFFGRQMVLDLLVKRANGLKSGYRQNVAIIGHQQIGKTSILRQFLHVYKDPEILAFCVEIKLQALDYFVDQFARSLLFQYLVRREPVDSTESLASLTQKAAPSIPKTVARIHEIAQLLKQRHAEEAYSKLFELTSVIRQETGLHCIVILDEFHRLGEFGLRNAFSNFGKRIMVQKDTMYLLSSSSYSASRRILAEKLALLFGNFERVYLEPFDFETSFDFLEKKLKPLTLNPSLAHFLVSFTDGHPFFLETITSRIRELAAVRGETEVSRQAVAEVLQKLLFESQGVLYQYFLKLLSPWTQAGGRGSHVLVLTQLAGGKNKLKDVAQAVNRSQSEVSEDIRELMEHELIVKNGVFHRFHNKIFKFWLREVYQKKELSLLGTHAKNEEFLAGVHAMIADSDELLGMDPSDRVAKLFGLFRNEIVELGEKRRQLPHFTEILPRPARTAGAREEVSGASARDLIARGHGRCWVCKIVEEKATEKEILDLVEGEPKDRAAARKSPPTRVLVALRGLDDNAKLLAKEKKILTLGLSRLNVLMDVYGKSPIVHLRRPRPPEPALPA
ncbi:MAG TPA: AAA family ATPase [Candidatus Eisenbacteria bacterium]|nr:AAA family ATPase [Candidatus Eisenbacteria bacterium]